MRTDRPPDGRASSAPGSESIKSFDGFLRVSSCLHVVVDKVATIAVDPSIQQVTNDAHFSMLGHHYLVIRILILNAVIKLTLINTHLKRVVILGKLPDRDL